MKGRLRREMKAALAGMPAEEDAAASRAACSAVLSLDEYRQARSVMLYAPIPGELDCLPVAEAAWREGKTVLLPRVGPSPGRMGAIPCGSLAETTPGAMAIREPAAGEAAAAGEIDFILVPALAYDRRGNRLGRGGGYYDRFLAQEGLRAVRCGFAFACQLVEELPVDSNDYPVDLVVTDNEILRLDRPPRERRGD